MHTPSITLQPRGIACACRKTPQHCSLKFLSARAARAADFYRIRAGLEVRKKRLNGLDGSTVSMRLFMSLNNFICCTKLRSIFCTLPSMSPTLSCCEGFGARGMATVLVRVQCIEWH